MRQGPNLLKLARKEQCLALLSQLRNKFKTDGQFYRVFPNGEVQYLHPKDGVYPEKVNKGREAVGSVDRRIGANPNPIQVSRSIIHSCLRHQAVFMSALLMFQCSSAAHIRWACPRHAACPVCVLSADHGQS